MVGIASFAVFVTFFRTKTKPAAELSEQSTTEIMEDDSGLLQKIKNLEEKMINIDMKHRAEIVFLRASANQQTNPIFSAIEKSWRDKIEKLVLGTSFALLIVIQYPFIVITNFSP